MSSTPHSTTAGDAASARRASQQQQQQQHVSPFDVDLLSTFLQSPPRSQSKSSLTSTPGPFTLAIREGMSSKDNLLRQTYDSNAKFSFFSPATDLIQGQTLENLQALQDRIGQDTFWLDVYGAREDDIRILAKIFQLHPLTTDDILYPEEAREKCEVFEHYMFLCINTLSQEQSFSPLFAEAFLYVILLPSCVITLHHAPLEHPMNVIARFLRERTDVRPLSPTSSLVHRSDILDHGSFFDPPPASLAPEGTSADELRSPALLSSTWIVYALMDDVIDCLRPVIDALEYDVDCIDDLIMILNSNEQGDMLMRMRGATKKVTQLIRLLHSKTEVIKTFSHRCSKQTHPDILMYLRDVQDHVITMRHTLQISLETLQNAHNIYLSHVNVELAQVSNESNNSMKTLSVVSAVFLPMSVITGLFGMNVTVPGQTLDGQDPLEQDKFWFWAIVAGMGVMAVVLCGLAKRFRML